MPSAKNINQVQDLEEKISHSSAFYFTDYRGLGVNQINELRRKVNEQGGAIEIVKNTLLKLALKKKNLSTQEAEANDAFAGPNAILWTNQDQVSPLKTLVAFAKENDSPKLKVGFLDQKFLSPEEVQKLSQMPSLKELQAQLVSQLIAPISRLRSSLGGNLTKLQLILGQLAKKDQQN